VCNAPTGLTTTNITINNATLNWTAVSGAVNYSLEYKLNSSSSWTPIAGTFNTTSYNLSGLSASSNYNWRVKTNCASGSSGFTSASFNSATLVCNSPSGLTANSITNNSVNLSWSSVSGAIGYTLEYKLSTSSTWTSIPGLVNSTSYTLTNLTASSLYNWQVKTNCSAGSSGYSSASITTNAPPVCPTPSGLNVSSITSNSATISWSAVSGAVSYSIDYKSNSSSTWLTVPGVQTSTSLTLNGLVASSAYDWRVKTNCASGSSGYTSSTFTSSPSTSLSCNAPGTLSVSNITSSSANLNWGAVSGASNYSIEYKLGSATTWKTIAGTMSSQSYNLTGLTPGTLYNWQVKTNCSSTSSTMTQSSFTTLVDITTCPGSVDVIENGVRTTAPSILSNSTTLGKIYPSSDNDYYKFVLSTATSLTSTLSNLPADFDLRILNSSGTTLGLSQKSNLTSEMIALNLSAGTYYVRVYGWGTSNHASSCYTLKLQTGSAATSSPAGIYSTNELITTIFPNPVRSDLNFDIYGFDISAVVTIMDVQNRKLIQTVTKSNLNQINVTNLAPGFYFLRVEDENKRRTTQKFMKTQ